MRFSVLTFIVCLIVLPAQAKYSGGSGTAADPYQVATAADLITLGETPGDYDKHFILTADIDLDPNLPGRKVFDKAVIAPDTNDVSWWFDDTPFTGLFVGNAHTISHLTIKGAGYVGLFGQLTGDVRDLGVVDVNIIGSFRIGGLVGYSEWGSVTQCYSTGVVSSTGDSVGGLVGCNFGGSLTRCYSTGKVGGRDYVGGLVGNNYGVLADCYSTGAVSGKNCVGGLVGSNDGDTFAPYPYVTYCYSTGVVTSTGDSVGGLVGQNGWGGGPVTQCYSTGAVRGGSNVGGLMGGRISGDVTACFWDVQTSGQATSAGGTGKTMAQMQDPSLFMAAGWDFVGQADGPHDIWAEPEGGGYPILWWQLSPLPSLPRFSGGTGEPNDPFRISTAQDLNSIGHNPRLMKCHFKLATDLDLTGVRFYPIGRGGYDHFDPDGCPYGGVFDGDGHTISHLVIEGTDNLGLFGGLGYGAAVKDLGAVDVNITGAGYAIGALVAWNDGTVTHCYSTGVVQGDGAVGGLVGDNYYTGTVSQCYSTAAVSGGDSVGGLAGWNDGALTQCYSTGAVSGTGHGVGGLVGSNHANVIQCYSIGAVRGGSNLGGFVGHNYYGAVDASFWDVQTSGQTTSAAGTGKTTAQMQTAKTFLDAGWDFVGETKNGTADIWWILEGKDYPRLWWELVPAK